MTPEQHKTVLDALQLFWRDVSMNDYAWEKLEEAIAIMEATAPVTQERKALSEVEVNALHDKLGGKPVHPTYNEIKLAKRWSETK